MPKKGKIYIGDNDPINALDISIKANLKNVTATLNDLQFSIEEVANSITTTSEALASFNSVSIPYQDWNQWGGVITSSDSWATYGSCKHLADPELRADPMGESYLLYCRSCDWLIGLLPKGWIGVNLL